MTPAISHDREVDPTTGPTIACAIDFLDRSESNQSFWIEDGAFLGLFNNYVRALQNRPDGVHGVMAKALLGRFNQFLREHDVLRHVMPWFAQGVDASDGVLSLQRSPVTGDSRLSLAWDIDRSRGVIEAIVSMHRELSAATGGKPLVSPSWSVFHDLVTPHPLGGCGIGNSSSEGVVNHAGEVFGYRNLYVTDAAIVPRALGVNPSRTIGALAERVAKIIKDESR